MRGWKEHHPDLLERAQRVNATFEVLTDVPELLSSVSVPLSSIDSIIRSHHHVDHTGDDSLFPPTTSHVAGPGIKTNPSLYPGFPLSPDAHVPHAAFAARDVIELGFNGTLKLAGLRSTPPSRPAQRRSTSSRRTSCLILILFRAARRLLRCRRLTRTNTYFLSFITIRPHANLVTLSHSRARRSRVASMAVLGSTLIVRTPYTGASWIIFVGASMCSVTNR